MLVFSLTSQRIECKSEIVRNSERLSEKNNFRNCENCPCTFDKPFLVVPRAWENRSAYSYICNVLTRLLRMNRKREEMLKEFKSWCDGSISGTSPEGVNIEKVKIRRNSGDNRFPEDDRITRFNFPRQAGKTYMEYTCNVVCMHVLFKSFTQCCGYSEQYNLRSYYFKKLPSWPYSNNADPIQEGSI